MAPFRVMHAGQICGGAQSMAAERILQAAILGLFIFSIVLASMLIMK